MTTAIGWAWDDRTVGPLEHRAQGGDNSVDIVDLSGDTRWMAGAAPSLSPTAAAVPDVVHTRVGSRHAASPGETRPVPTIHGPDDPDDFSIHKFL
jgi:hypothetical protein